VKNSYTCESLQAAIHMQNSQDARSRPAKINTNHILKTAE